jgi:23S rRNA (cytidine1920-2'-O)/16S rRNA (cytidine1409-2'-O)-methyltransferase
VSLTRLDVALVQRGLARSRNHASKLIAAGRVYLAGQEAKKSSQQISDDAELTVLQAEDYVSRAGHKLAAALDEFQISPEGKICLDVGASTGGFSDVLLRRGARTVIAVDVGHSQLAPELEDYPKLINIENFNAREMTLANLSQASSLKLTEDSIKLLVADLSFISLTLVLANFKAVAPSADMVLLIKPQFEVGKASLDASGIVNDHRLRANAVNQVLEAAKGLGLGLHGLTRSPLPGTHGNQEYLVWLNSVETDWSKGWSARIDEMVKSKG